MDTPDKQPKAYSYIRMSTAAQLKGDSLRRQLELSQRYADMHGLELVEDFKLTDIGVSAYRGANVTEGALGRFLDLVRTGEIEQGSYLLVESLDRISRQQLKKSILLFMSITGAGINVVTVADGHLYRAGSDDLTDLIISMVILSRGHEESRTKAHRLAEAWAHKRKHAKEKKLTATCPAWLRLSKNKKKFEIIGDRAEVVRSIFENTAAGLGNYLLTKKLNHNSVPHFGKSNGWHNSYVSKILNNRAVIGEFQPHKVVDGRRVPDGEPIKDYFHRLYRLICFTELNLPVGNGRQMVLAERGETLPTSFLA